MVKREIVAYKYDGRCKVLHNTIPNFDECVKKGATRSAAPSCGGETSARKVVDEIYPQIKDNPKIETLLNNTDLGVG